MNGTNLVSAFANKMDVYRTQENTERARSREHKKRKRGCWNPLKSFSCYIIHCIFPSGTLLTSCKPSKMEILTPSGNKEKFPAKEMENKTSLGSCSTTLQVKAFCWHHW